MLLAIAVIGALVVGAGGVAFARSRVQDDARSQRRRTLDRDGSVVERLAAVDAPGRISGGIPAPGPGDFARAHRVADWLGLLSPRLSGGLRSETRDAARTLDEAVLEARVLELVTAGALDLDAARTAYAANTTMRRAASDLARLDREL
ncbi:MAG: hypothetical protein M3046_10765 [Actinomycetota bacterium]|nr:hypothetical protein [Actinomycetota bacterium]